MASNVPERAFTQNGERSALVDIDRHGSALAERLLEEIDPVSGGFGRQEPRSVAVAALQLLWRHYMVTGALRFSDAVRHALGAICRSSRVEHVGGGVHRDRKSDAGKLTHIEETLADNAQRLELITWVWRVDRCPALRSCAEEIAGSVVADMRLPGFGFAASAGADKRDSRVRADWNGLMLVALVEAGSVFERRDWLVLAREVFDELVANLADADTLRHSAADECRAPVACLDDYAMMSRAALRLFEAFGKRRYLERAVAWVATLDDTFWDDSDGAYRVSPADARTPTSRSRVVGDGALQCGNALMIGVLARLQALTGAQRYAERARHLAEVLHPVIMQSGIDGATAIANAQTAAQLVLIEVAGDPRLPATRELMRIALDCGLPDRLVLGPGAGVTLGESPRAQIRIGTDRLAPIGDAASLRAMLAAGGFMSRSSRETVDSRSRSGIPYARQ